MVVPAQAAAQAHTSPPPSGSATGSGRALTQSLWELVAAQVQSHPRRVAITHRGASVTYAQLGERAGRIAAQLRLRGIGAGSRVALCLDRGLDQICAVVGILKSGAAYVPLDPAYPLERLGYMLSNADIQLLISTSSLAAGLPTDALPVQTPDELMAACPLEPQGDTPDQNALVYVLYTSGSTGAPKGVAMGQAALLNLVKWQLEQSRNLPEGARTLQFSPLGFDVSFQEIFSTLASGGTLVLVDEAVRRDPHRLLKLLQEEDIHRLFLPFVALRQLAEAFADHRLVTPALTEVITAGEQLRCTQELRAWFKAMPGCSLHNHYGPTETHVVTAHSLSGPPELWPDLPSVGLPLPNVQLWILDEDLLPVEQGQIGELYVSGVCLADGYLGRPDLTVERFFSWAPPGKSARRLYRTGDLGRTDSDGTILFLGRSDGQVKIRGFRVEPGEVEALLEGHDQVRAAVVEARPLGQGDLALVAYVLPEASAGEELAAQLGPWLRERAPSYLVPSRCVLVEAFPLTPSGKVNRKALPTPPEQHTRKNPTAARNGTEAALCKLWSELLGMEHVGVHEGFEDLGGHSLLLAQLVHRVHAQFAVTLDIGQLLEGLTVARLAALIEGEHSPRAAQPTAPPRSRVLCDAVRPPMATRSAPRDVLLTGASGFLGARLLHDLLRDETGDVYCLVRATHPAQGLDRIRHKMESFGWWENDFADRLVPIPGDLAEPGLGIGQAHRRRLQERVEAVYHCAAWVNLLYPYAALEACNVDGTEEILRLAATGRNAAVHYVSTMDVYSTLGLASDAHPAQAGPADQLPTGYAQSKYVAECLVEEAGRRGVPVAIYRPGNLLGDLVGSRCPAENAVAIVLRAVVALRLAPALDATLQILPVDLASQQILSLSRDQACLGRAHDVFSSGDVSWRELVALAEAQLGERVGLVSLPTFRDAVLAALSGDVAHPAGAALPLLWDETHLLAALGGFTHRPISWDRAFHRVGQGWLSRNVESMLLPMESMWSLEPSLNSRGLGLG